jgi:hypothetical protein
MNTFQDKIRKKLVYARARVNRVAYRWMDVPQPGKWVFILGCYNSGTTLLHQLLSLHPSVGAMPLEGRQFTDELPLAEDYGLDRLWALNPDRFYLDERMGGDIDVSKIKRQWAFMYNHPRRPVLLEKSVINAGRSRWLQRHFENSYFIVLVRNGYAIAEGIRRKAGHSIEKGILQWKNSYEILFRDMPFLERKIQLTYEELTAAPAATLGKITGFLDLEPLSGKVISRRFKVHGEENPILDMNAKSICRLSADDCSLINGLAGDLLKKTGYPLIQSGQTVG